MLTIAGLGHRYPGGTQAALDAVSLTVRRGSVFGLLGPNGAGKTTLIAHLAGLLPVREGSITLDGIPLAETRRTDPTRIALAPQEYAFFPTLTVTENLRAFAGASRLAGARAGAAIDRCTALAQLERHAGQRAERLSGGLKRRLNLAIALLAEPALLLLDEPTAGVDPQSRAFLLDAVRALAAAGTTVIYTSHYMEEIEAIADQVAILDQGRVLRHGPLAALLADGARRLELRVAAADAAPARRLLAGFGRLEEIGPAGANATAAPSRTRESAVSSEPTAATTIAVELAAEHSALAALNALAAAGIAVAAADYGADHLDRLFLRLTHRALRDD